MKRFILPVLSLAFLATGCAKPKAIEQKFEVLGRKLGEVEQRLEVVEKPPKRSLMYERTERIRVRISKPYDSYNYLQMHVSYSNDPGYDEGIESDDWRSLEWTLEHGTGDCDDFAIASAGLLGDNGYPPTLLLLGGNISGVGVDI